MNNKTSLADRGNRELALDILVRQISVARFVIGISFFFLLVFAFVDWWEYHARWQITEAFYALVGVTLLLFGALGWIFLRLGAVGKRLIGDEVSQRHATVLVFTTAAVVTTVNVISSSLAWFYGAEITGFAYSLFLFNILYLLTDRQRFIYNLLFMLSFGAIMTARYLWLSGSSFDQVLHAVGWSFHAPPPELFVDSLLHIVAFVGLLHYAGNRVYSWYTDAFLQRQALQASLETVEKAQSRAEAAIRAERDAVEAVCAEMGAEAPNDYSKIGAAAFIGRLFAERKAVSDQLETTSRSYDDFVRNCIDSVITIDSAGDIVGVNPASARLLRTTEADMLSRPLIEYVHPDDLGLYARAIESLSDSGAFEGLEGRVVDAHGETILCQISAWAITDERGRMVGAHGMLRDITQIREAQRAIGDAHDRQSHTLKNICDALFTPLNAITGFSRLLQDTPLNDEQRKWLGQIQRSSATLKSVAMRGLPGYASDHALLSPQRRQLDLPALLRQHHQQRADQPTAGAAPYPVALTIDREFPERLYGDEKLLGGLIDLLLGTVDEAVPAGELHLHASGCGAERCGGQLIRRFAAGSQAGDRARQIAVLCEAYIEQLGGQATLTTGEDGDPLYRIDFQLAATANAPTADDMLTDAPGEKASPVLKGKRMLVVDDSPANRAYLAALLKQWRADVDVATDGDEAIDACKDHHYDMIFMDLRMPRVDGLQATRAIRQLDNDNRHTLIVAVTAHALSSEKTEVLNAGMNGFLAKPLEAERLANEIAHQFAGRG